MRFRLCGCQSTTNRLAFELTDIVTEVWAVSVVYVKAVVNGLLH